MTSTDGQKSTTTTWRNRIIGTVTVLAVLVVTYLILAAFIPRWWAQRVGDLVGKSFSKGIGWGLAIGGVCTLVSLLLLLFAVLIWRRRMGRFIAGACALLAVLFAIPNLMTLSVVRGTNNAAEAGRQIMNVDAPAFRGASLAGVIAAVVLFLLVATASARRGWRRRRAAKVPAAQQSAPAAPPSAPVSGDTDPTHHNTL